MSEPLRICCANSALKEAMNASSRGRNLSPANLRYLQQSQPPLRGAVGLLPEPADTYSVMMAASVQPCNLR